jgi:hypothetical protein
MAPYRIARLGALAFVAVTVLLTLRSTRAPEPLPATAPAEAFSALRARQHLERIAAVPHPVGSDAHREVREYLLRSLRELGVTPEVQSTSALSPDLTPYFIPGATVHNVIARLEGENPDKAVAIVAHYDSVPTSPGASDNGAAVAAMLETLRALKAGPRPRNDLLFLFTDAEEVGLAGARAFAQQHPLAQKVAVVLNFEARGSHGPSLLFQSSSGNSWLIAQAARAGVSAQASSLFYEVYRRLPNDTDLTVFLEQGKAGLNFGWIDGFMRYHARSDDVANLDPRSLQHHGESMLALARHLGQVELEPSSTSDSIYFNIGSLLVHYPASWSVPLAILSLIALAATLVWGARQGRLRWGRVALGLAALLAVAVGAAVASFVAWMAVGAIDGGLRELPQNDAYRNHLFIAGLVALTVAVVAALQGAFLRKLLRPGELIAGALCGWLLLGLLTSLWVSGMSYLFTWPLLSGTLGLGLLLRSSQEPPSPGAILGLAATTVPALLLWVPQVVNLYVALTLALAGGVAVLLALWVGLLLPQLFTAQRLARAAALPALGLSLVLLSIGVLLERFDAAHPRPASLVYLVDTARSEALWASSDFEPDAWTAKFLGGAAEQRLLDTYFPTFWRSVHTAPAPMTPLLAPEVRVSRDVTHEGTRALTLHVASRRQAPRLQLLLAPGLPLQGLSVAGERLGPAALKKLKEDTGGGVIEYWAPPPDGLALELEVPAGTPVRLQVSDTRFDLKEAPGEPSQSRPAHTAPIPYGFALTDQVTVVGAVEL